MAIDPQVRERILAQLGPMFAHAYPKLLEQHHPQVLEKIAKLTTPAEIERFFDDLMLTQRTDRHGFSVEVFGELLALTNIYRKLHKLPEPPRKEGDVWGWVGEVGIDAGEHHDG